MKKILLASILILLASCSKEQSDAVTPLVQPPTESSETISLVVINKAKEDYLKSKMIFDELDNERLSAKIDIAETYLEKARTYISLLKLSANQDEELERVSNLSKQDALILEGLKVELEKLYETKSAIESSKMKLEELRKNTNDFTLTNITEQGNRDSILNEIDNLRNNIKFIELTYENEFEAEELQSHLDLLANLTPVSELFSDYFKFKEVLSNSKSSLEKVDYSSVAAPGQLRVAALTHELSFFKALNEHISAINTFKSDASIFLNEKDLADLNKNKEKIINDLKSLEEIKSTQEAIQRDLNRIEYMGYKFPKNIESLKEDELKWQDHEVFILNSVLPEKVKWEPGLHRVNPLFNDNYPLEVITKYNLFERVTKKSYSDFDDAFGTAFTRLFMYRSTFKESMPNEKRSYYFKLMSFLTNTYGLVTDYVEGLPF